MKIGNGDNGATPLPARAPGSWEMAAGLMLMLVSVGVGINSGAGGIGLLLSFPGVVAGVILTVIGVRAADVGGWAPVVPAAIDGARGIVPFTRRDLALVGLALASCAVVAVSGEAAGPMLCFSMFAVLLLGVYLISI